MILPTPPRRRPSAPAAFAAALLLGACAAVRPVPTDVATPGMPNPEVALRESMRTVDAQMAGLGLGPRAAAAALPTVAAPPAVAAAPPPPPPPLPTGPVIPSGPAGVLPEPLQRTVSFAWDGPLDEGVARMAASVGYAFFVTAPRGTTPPTIAVALRDVPAWEVFRAFGEAARGVATVRLVPTHAQVQVIYRG